jgi:hypothetical protein
MDWHHVLERTAAMLTSLLGVLTSLLGVLTRSLELFIENIEPHRNLAAATVYLVIVVVIGLVVAATRSERHIRKVMHRSWNKPAARNAWTLALIMFFANGVLHAVEQTEWLSAKPLETSKIPFVAHLSTNTLLALAVSASLWFVVLGFYINDARKKRNFGRPKPAFKYFGVVLATWTFEDAINMYWEHYGIKERIGDILESLRHVPGEIILIGILVFVGLVFIALRKPSVQGALEDGLSEQM